MTALGALGQRGGVLEAVGLDEVEKWCRDVDRKASRDRQKAVRLVARRTLVPAVRAEASTVTGKAGPALAAAPTSQFPEVHTRAAQIRLRLAALNFGLTARRTVGGA